MKVFNNSRICCWSEDEYGMKMLGWGGREAGTVGQMAEVAPVCRDVPQVHPPRHGCGINSYINGRLCGLDC